MWQLKCGRSMAGAGSDFSCVENYQFNYDPKKIQSVVC
jgi:hypothetical protein